MNKEMAQVSVMDSRTKRMMARIIRLEKDNIQTKHYSDADMVKKIKSIIREEAEAYVD